ncbi:MAG: tyrosine--tRNA ligase [Armatimonadota bacterium]|nr:MAG: tyrosine--tRNA ligase [Armatimonadota bacterium]
MLEPDEQLKIITRHAVDVVTEDDLLAKLRERRPLRVKYGADPSAPDLHLGHSVTMRAMRDLQDLGHHIIFIIGDFTGMLGDPSGRSKTRPQLSREEIEQNADTYAAQVSKILDMQQAELRYNSEWLSRLDAMDVVRLAAKTTVARMLERDDFAKRYAAGQPLGVHEMLYPIFQGYDSVAIEADIELGGTDQIFNFLLAREMQRDIGQASQVVITRPLIVGTDGTQKMSKSLGNYIGISEPPDEMYGKLMSLPDEHTVTYLELCTDVSEEDIRAMEAAMARGELNPRDAKARLAREIVTLYHDAQAAREAEEAFQRLFAGGKQVDRDTLLEAAERVQLDRTLEGSAVWASKALHLTGLAPSHSEARRLIGQGGVWIDDRKVENPQEEVTLREGMLLRIGKRRVAVLSFRS